MRIKSLETFFQPACDEIIKLLKKMFQSPKLIDVKKILMVGGVSESCIFQEAIRDAFPNCQVVVPVWLFYVGQFYLGFIQGPNPVAFQDTHMVWTKMLDLTQQYTKSLKRKL